MMKLLVFLVTSVVCDVSFNAYHPLFLNDGYNGYHYPVPDPPVQFDEPPLPPPSYGPPIFNVSFPPLQDEIPSLYPTYLPPPPQFDPAPPDDTVAILPPPNQYLPPSTRTTDLQIFNMSCLDTNNNKFFQVSFKTNHFLENPPVVEDDSQSDCVTGFGDRFKMDLDGGKMVRCGVKKCQVGEKTNMCVTLRMATVKGLKLPEDTLVTLQCKPQDSIVTHTKQFRVKPFVIQSRSSALVASGGSQKHFETQVGLFRRTPGVSGDYTLAIAPGAALPLGEDLLLRATVREGDGWKYIRMGPVVAHRITSTPSIRTTTNSATLVNSAGCRLPNMKGVCPEQPRHVTPLTVTLPMRAFMFQGAKSGDEMVLSVRMVGCLQAEDCFQNTFCDDRPQARTRTKRDNLKSSQAKDNTTDWESYLEFRVVLPDVHQVKKERDATEGLSVETIVPILIFGGTGIVVILAIVASLARKL